MDLLQALETQKQQAERRIKSRYALSQMKAAGFPKPRFGSVAYNQYVEKGWISPEEVESDQLKKEIRAERTGQRKIAGRWHSLATMLVQAPRPTRWGNEKPIPSDQYAPAMATTAARDNRLTPQAKALLQVIHARCGREGRTTTTKGTLANIMSRSERSIQRYVAELIKFCYLVTEIRKNARGLYTGLVVRVSSQVQPFWDSLERCSKWMSKTLSSDEMPFSTQSASQNSYIIEKTQLSYKNQTHLYNNKRTRIRVT